MSIPWCCFFTLVRLSCFLVPINGVEFISTPYCLSMPILIFLILFKVIFFFFLFLFFFTFFFLFFYLFVLYYYFCIVVFIFSPSLLKSFYSLPTPEITDHLITFLTLA